ncbi:MAG: hypothetical protein FWG83_08355 [Oscillospiraceae bacterium]|nr:hypothetical protein [Oscillospiraceae bacterium]
MLPLLGINEWKEETLSDFVAKIFKITFKPLILIDGDGGSGKTTLARRLVNIFGANLVSTDDICWCADPVNWDGEMINGIILPWITEIDGKNVTYRPSGWVKENRHGFIEVDSSKPLIIEGIGAYRKSLREFATYSVWVDTNPNIAKTRVIQRDLTAGFNGGTLESVTEFTDWWNSLVHPFIIKEEPWKYADVIISGSQSDLNSDNLLIYINDCTEGE